MKVTILERIRLVCSSRAAPCYGTSNSIYFHVYCDSCVMLAGFVLTSNILTLLVTNGIKAYNIFVSLAIGFLFALTGI